jgi:hypothetical protein
MALTSALNRCHQQAIKYEHYILTNIPKPAFPSPIAEDAANSAKLMANFAAVFSILGAFIAGIPGGALLDEAITLASGVLGVSGGVYGAVGATIKDNANDLTETSLLLLNERVQNVFTTFVTGLSSNAMDVFGTGNLSSWPAGLHNTTSVGGGSRTSDLAAFFDNGRYLVPVDFEVHLKTVAHNFSQSLVGTQLTSTGYYILRNAHTVADCADIAGGLVKDGVCWTIEYPGVGVADESYDATHKTTIFSKPISQDSVDTMTNSSGFAISISDVITNSYACQLATGTYNSNYQLDVDILSLGTIPNCFYSLTVLEVLPDDGNQDPKLSTPCYMWDVVNGNGTDARRIGTYLPPLLATVFTADFCVNECYDEGSKFPALCGLSTIP